MSQANQQSTTLWWTYLCCQPQPCRACSTSPCTERRHALTCRVQLSHKPQMTLVNVSSDLLRGLSCIHTWRFSGLTDILCITAHSQGLLFQACHCNTCRAPWCHQRSSQRPVHSVTQVRRHFLVQVGVIIELAWLHDTSNGCK